MKIKPNYLIIPGIVATVALIGSAFTTPNLDWYQTLKLPSFAPPGQIIGLVWTTLYILIAAAVLIYWNKVEHNKIITAHFITNAVLNASWSLVFFGQKEIGWAIFVSAWMAVTIYVLIYLLYPKNKTAAFLLVPYAAWVTFATYLNYLIWTLN